MRKYLTGLLCGAVLGATLGGPAFADDASDLAAATLKKAQADAEKSKWDAANAKSTYRNAIPAPAESGATSVKDGAGQIEANVLAARAVEDIAKTIGTEVQSVCGSANVMLMAASENALLVHWDQFRFRSDRLNAAFDKAQADFDAQTKPAGGRFRPLDITGIGETASAVTKLIGYFMTDYEIGGVTITEDDSLLIAAVAGNLSCPHYVAGRLNKPGAADDVFAIIKALDDKNIKASGSLKLAQGLSAQAQKIVDDKKASDADKKAAQAIIDKFKAPIDELTAATAAFQTFVASLAQSDAAGLPLPLVIQEKAQADIIGANGYGLFLHIQHAGGGYYTEHSIWTIFGGIPFYVSGGAIVSYTLIARTDGRIVKSGVLDKNSNYQRVDKIN